MVSKVTLPVPTGSQINHIKPAFLKASEVVEKQFTEIVVREHLFDLLGDAICVQFW